MNDVEMTRKLNLKLIAKLEKEDRRKKQLVPGLTNKQALLMCRSTDIERK